MMIATQLVEKYIKVEGQVLTKLILIFGLPISFVSVTKSLIFSDQRQWMPPG